MLLPVPYMQPREEIDVRSEISAKVTNIQFKEGTRVSKGQLLVKMFDADLQAKLEKSKLQIELKAKLLNTKAGLNDLLVTDPASVYEVSDKITFLALSDYKTLVSSLPVSNSQIEFANQNSSITEINYCLNHSPK